MVEALAVARSHYACYNWCLVLAGNPATPITDTLAGVEPTDYRCNKTSPPTFHITWAPLVKHVLDSFGSITKTPSSNWLRNNKNLCLIVLEAESPRSEWQNWVLARPTTSRCVIISLYHDREQRKRDSSLWHFFLFLTSG